MDTNVKSIQVARESRFVNIGHVVDGELLIFQINFMINAHNWGVTVVDPDGNTTTKLAQLGHSIDEMVVPVGESKIVIDIMDNIEQGIFEIYYL